MKFIVFILIIFLASCATNRLSKNIENYVNWETAVEILMTEYSNISAISQGHNLHVNIIFKDNTYVSTIEPKIDEIFKHLKKCGNNCGHIDKITE